MGTSFLWYQIGEQAARLAAGFLVEERCHPATAAALRLVLQETGAPAARGVARLRIADKLEVRVESCDRAVIAGVVEAIVPTAEKIETGAEEEDAIGKEDSEKAGAEILPWNHAEVHATHIKAIAGVGGTV